MSEQTVGDLAKSVRSKSAGPFWLTFDMFFDDRESFEQVCNTLRDAVVAERFS